MACRVCKTPLSNIRIYFLVIPNDTLRCGVGATFNDIPGENADRRIFHKTT